jgi:hypothetical protein
MIDKTTDATNAAARFVGALLCVQVGIIHVIDQGGIPGTKTPTYVGAGYWVLEILGLVTAAGLITDRSPRLTWFVAIGVGAGPLTGYILSRGPGLPGYTDDVGNWGEPLGVFSLVAEAILIVLAVTSFLRSLRQPAQQAERRAQRQPSAVS